MNPSEPLTVLITLGRLPPAVDLARSFKARGWRVVVCDPFDRHMAGTSRCVDHSAAVPAPADHPKAFLQAVLSLVARWNVSLVVPVSEETMHVAALKSALPKDTALFCGTQSDVLGLHSKLAFADAACELDLPVAQTARAMTGGASQLLAAHDCIVKPEFSCSGRSITMLPAGGALPAEIDDGFVVQRAISGEEFSAFGIAHNGVPTGIVVYRAMVRHGSVAVAFERVNHPSIDDWVTRFITATRHHGFIAFDFIVDTAGTPFAIECNPRATSGLHCFETQSIAPAIVDGAAPALRSQTQLQEFWSNWTHWLASLGTASERRKTGKTLRQSRDVTWLASDPWVFLLATYSTWPIIRKAMRHKTDFAKVLALDIEWRAEHQING